PSHDTSDRHCIRRREISACLPAALSQTLHFPTDTSPPGYKHAVAGMDCSLATVDWIAGESLFDHSWLPLSYPTCSWPNVPCHDMTLQTASGHIQSPVKNEELNDRYRPHSQGCR